MKKRNLLLFALLGMVTFFNACTKDDLPVAVPLTGTKTLSVNFSPASPYAFFRFQDSAVVANVDSASSKWDFGIRFTKFITNAGVSGPGKAGVILQDGIYSAITMAPTAGFAYDTTASQLAIKDGSWYDYNGATRSFVPKAGKVFIFKTADGAHFAKMQLLAVDYAPFTGPVPAVLLYKFQYTYQSSGSNSFQ